jgi:hypothetical protein
VARSHRSHPYGLQPFRRFNLPSWQAGAQLVETTPAANGVSHPVVVELFAELFVADKKLKNVALVYISASSWPMLGTVVKRGVKLPPENVFR